MTTFTTIHTPKDDSRLYIATSRAAAQDTRLSFEARGLLWYLLSKPGDWRITIPDLMRAGHCGRDRVYRLLQELKEAGYIERERLRTEKGTLTWEDYRVHENPISPLPEKPDTEKPDMVLLSPLPENPDTEKPDMDVLPSLPGQEMAPVPPPPQTPPPRSPGSPGSIDPHGLHNSGDLDIIDLDLDSGSPPPYIPPPTGAVMPSAPSVGGSLPMALFRHIQQVLVERVWSGNQKRYGAAGDMAKMLLGCSDKRPYVDYNFTQPVEADEFDAWVDWWAAKGLNFPRSPQAVEQAWIDFRADKAARRQLAERRAEKRTAELTDSERLMARILGLEGAL